MILLATNLKPLPEEKTYELWVIPANGRLPCLQDSFARMLWALRPWCCRHLLPVFAPKHSG